MRRCSTTVVSFMAALLLTVISGVAPAQPIGGTLESPAAFLVSADIGFADASVGAPQIEQIGVKLDMGGVPGFCHPLTQTCGWLSPAELVFSEQVLVGGLARVEVWSLAGVPAHMLMRLDGTPCSAEDECSLGVGYLLLLLNAAGQPLAGHAELGIEDFDSHFSQGRVLSTSGGSTSLLWIETSTFCGGECVQYAWTEIRLRSEPGHQPLTVRAGPFSTGLSDVELRENPDGSVEMCRTTRRVEPTYDASTGRLSLVHSLELVGESAQTQTITYTADGMIVSSVVALATGVDVPPSVQECEVGDVPEKLRKSER